MAFLFVLLFCMVHSLPPVKRSGGTVPIVVNRPGKECPTKGSGQRKNQEKNNPKSPKRDIICIPTGKKWAREMVNGVSGSTKCGLEL